MAPSVATAGVGAELGSEAAAAGIGVRHALMHLIASMPEPVNTAKGLQRALGLDYNVCWHLMGIVKEPDPMEVVRLVPGEASMKKVVAAAAGIGLEPAVAESLETAVADFNRVVKAHAGDHITFKSMVASMAGEDAAESVMLKHRRTVFRSETQIRGTQVKKFLSQSYVGPKEDAGHPVYVLVNAKAGFQRLRASVRPVICGRRTVSSNEKSVETEPLDAEAAKLHGAPLLPQFCSHPLPKIGTIKGSDDDWTYYVLESEKLGRMAAADLVNATVTRGVSLGGMVEGVGMTYRGIFKCVVPTEELIVEFLVHRPTHGAVTTRFALVPMEGVDMTAEMISPTPQIPTFEKVETLGRTDRAPAVGGIRRYGEMTRYVIEKMGWKIEDFDTYRVTVPCPSMHTHGVMWCPINDQRDEAPAKA